MSSRLIDRSEDLRRLRDEGYEVSVRAGYLVVDHIPYVTPNRAVAFGRLVSELTLAGDVTSTPGTHTLMFTGEFPCHKDGSPIRQLEHGAARQALADGLVVNFSFSNKPPGGYTSYYEKITSYVRVISSPASALDESATARTYRLVVSDPEDPAFQYADTASSRQATAGMSAKFRSERIAIVGLGGTGAYTLDLVAKTPVAEIHLFDGDKFVQHNAFRAPGAASVEELEATPTKVDHFAVMYSRMHKGIRSRPIYVDADTVSELDGMTFVFVCVDRGSARRRVVEHLLARRIPFIDVGMAVAPCDGALIGTLRVTLATPTKSDHVRARLSTEDREDDAYASPVQVADLNMMNAALAVLRWKKHLGFYQDLEREHHSTYSLNVNQLLGDHQA